MDMVVKISSSCTPGNLLPRAPVSSRSCFSSGALQLQSNAVALHSKVRLQEPRNEDEALRRRRLLLVCSADMEGNEGAAGVSIAEEQEEEDELSTESSQQNEDAAAAADAPLTPEEIEDQECVDQIVKVLDLLKKNRDMTPNEVRLIVMIEDPRESEGLGMLSEDGEWTSLRDEIGNAVIDISEGRVPNDREVLRALRDELLAWPNLEQGPEKSDPRKSKYAEITDTGIDPAVAGERANVDWDEAAEIVLPEQQKQAEDESTSMPPVLGYSVLYLVSFLPVLIGITVVAILYFNSFQ